MIPYVSYDLTGKPRDEHVYAHAHASRAETIPFMFWTIMEHSWSMMGFGPCGTPEASSLGGQQADLQHDRAAGSVEMTENSMQRRVRRPGGEIPFPFLPKMLAAGRRRWPVGWAILASLIILYRYLDPSRAVGSSSSWHVIPVLAYKLVF